jgi:D-3-phosphoglycerate dehydrogenase / 2-oxoglutarate reductase
MAKGLFCFDMESTLVDAEMFVELGKKLGLAEMEKITELAMNNELDLHESTQLRMNLLKGLDIEEYKKTAHELPLLMNAKELISQLQEQGHHVAILTGSFEPAVKIIAEKLGVDSYHCHDVETKDGKLTGNFSYKFKEKSEVLQRLVNEIKPDFTVAIGDGGNDIGMVEAADIGIGLNAKNVLKEKARICVDSKDAMEILGLFNHEMNIVIDNSVHKEAARMFSLIGKVKVEETRIAQNISYAEIIVVRTKTKVDKNYIDNMPNLKIIATATTGTDHIDIPYAESKGIKVVFAAGENAEAVADYVMRGIMHATDDVFYTSRHLKEGKDFLKTKTENQRKELRSMSLGIIGFGNIGRKVSKRAQGFGMKVLAYDPYNSQARDTLDDVLGCDAITIHSVLTPETRGMIGREEIALMKEGAILINASRGELIDEDALYEALKEGKIKAAVLDVFSGEPEPSKLFELENVICTPHIAGNSEEGKLNGAKKVFAETAKHLKSTRIKNEQAIHTRTG